MSNAFVLGACSLFLIIWNIGIGGIALFAGDIATTTLFAIVNIIGVVMLVKATATVA